MREGFGLEFAGTGSDFSGAEVTGYMTTIYCEDGQRYPFRFKDRKSVLRLVVQGKAGKRLVGQAVWPAAAACILRCVVQAPDGTVLSDEVNSSHSRFLSYELECPAEGSYVVYLMPLAAGGPTVSFEFCAGSGISRRLPVVFVVDRSRSMSNEDMDLIAGGLKVLLGELCSDPCSLETAALSCVSFDSTPLIHSPLTDLLSYELPLLNRHPLNEGDIGAALRALECFLAESVRPATEVRKGDSEPVVYVLTNGRCPNGWDRITRSNYTVVLTGSDPDFERARRLSDTVVELTECEDARALTMFFRRVWMS